MSVTIGALRESAPRETRVSLVPEVAEKFAKEGARLLIERSAGERAGFPDALYKNVTWAQSAADVLAQSDVLLTVQPLGVEQIGALKKTAVLVAASTLQKSLPMLTTAAGTIRPAQVLVIGAGVAGLQAIATARRLGAVVEAYDVRSATREQVKSLGAKFVDTGVSADGQGGYARELTDEEKKRQQEVLDARIAAADVVVSTASVPGRAAPKIISRAAVERMRSGAVIVDIAAEQGG